jgi:hypothetical protein
MFCTIFYAHTHMDAGNTTVTPSSTLVWVKSHQRNPCYTPGLNKADQDRKGAWQGKPSDLESAVVKHGKCQGDRARESGHPHLHRSTPPSRMQRCFSTGLSQPCFLDCARALNVIE